MSKLFNQTTLLNAVGAVDDGVWIDTGNFNEASIHVEGITTATVQIRGSDESTKPANTDHAVQIGTDITADGRVEVAVLPRFIKARISVFTAGTISVFMTMRGRK